MARTVSRVPTSASGKSRAKQLQSVQSQTYTRHEPNPDWLTRGQRQGQENLDAILGGRERVVAAEKALKTAIRGADPVAIQNASMEHTVACLALAHMVGKA